MTFAEIVARMLAMFSAEMVATPTITLRAGNELDDYRTPSAFVSAFDAVSDSYLEQFHWGVSHLDAVSWRHYLPYLIEYASRHMQSGSIVVVTLLENLRPPDRVPPRLASLSVEQEAVVVDFLDVLAFSAESAHQELACQVLEEWWAPGAIYREVAK